MATFDAAAFKQAVIDVVMQAVADAADKAKESAIADAPVRAVFKRGQTRRRRGLRRRAMTIEEAHSENEVRRLMQSRSPGTPEMPRPLRLAQPGDWTAGRKFTPDPYLRLASTRKGNPNSFAPLTLKAAQAGHGRMIKADATRAGTTGRFEGTPAVMGGREVRAEKIGRYHRFHMRSPQADKNLDSRGRNELRTGRALFQGNLGGRLRGSIKVQGPHLIGSVIKARVVSPVSYSQYQEFGTRHNRATPYMRPAIAKMQTTYRRDMVKALNSIRWNVTGKSR